MRCFGIAQIEMRVVDALFVILINHYPGSVQSFFLRDDRIVIKAAAGRVQITTRCRTRPVRFGLLWNWVCEIARARMRIDEIVR